MHKYLRLIMGGLAFIMQAQAGTLPAIRVQPYAVDTGTVYESMESTLVEDLRQPPNLYLQNQSYSGQRASAIFRGLRSHHTLVFLDGIPVNDPNAGQADLSHFTMAGANQTTVISGPETILQSGQTAGIIHLNTKGGNKGAIEGGSFETAKANVKYTVQKPHGTHTLVANHMQTAGLPQYGPSRIAGERNRYNQENGGVISHISLGERTWMKTSLRAINSVLKYDHNTVAPLPSKPQGTQNAAIYLFGAEANHESKSGKWLQQLSATYGKQNVDYAPNMFAHTKESTVAYRHDLRWSWAHRTRLVADTSATNLRKAGNFNKQRSVSGLAALHAVRLTDTWSAEAGVRQDHAVKYKLLPRLTAGLAWEKAKTKVYGSWRQSTRLPLLTEIYTQGVVLPNPNLKQEHMNLAELGWKQKLGKSSTLQLVYFYNRLHNMIAWTPLNPTHSTNINVPGESIFQGLETSLQHTWQNDVSLQGSYTYTNSAFDKKANMKPVAPQHNVSLHLKVPIADEWAFSTSLEYVSARFSIAQKMDPYTLNHIQMIYRIKPGYELYAQIKNIWDRRYETATNYRAPGRAFHVGTRFAF